VTQIEEVRSVSERYSAATLSVLRVTFLSALVLELAATLSIAVVAVEIGLRLLHGGISFQAAFFILVIAPEFYQPLRTLGMRFHSGISGVTAAKPIFEFLALPENETKKIEMDESWQEGIEWEQDLEIKFEGVGYTYPARGSEAVQDMSFTVKAGQKIAIVGKSGAGKSTLVNLLLKFISPQQGRITINGVNLGAIPVEEWRKRVAWVAQNPTIFHGTIGENIRLGKPEATIDEVRIAARNAILDGFIAKLPLGYDTPVGERGARLSAGEGQRLALARAFLVDTPILILDEPTTHLDIELETELVTAIGSLCRGKTVITIAHRLSTIQEADQVLVLEKGKIIEQGTPDLLRIDGGYFSNLLESEDWR
jgi:ATP-binding cassette subfamily C protein CydD